MEAAVFSMTNLFDTSCTAGSDEDAKAEDGNCSTAPQYVENEHHLSGQTIIIREFDFHPVNANLVWPGTASFAEWLLENRRLVEEKEVLEIGSGTGILAIFLAKALRSRVTTSDYDDAEIEENIAYNFQKNGLEPAPHVRRIRLALGSARTLRWNNPLETSARQLPLEFALLSLVLSFELR